jgi:Trehalose utilisation/Ankyrin repeats (3 copies)/Ankyrin repeat
MNRLHICLLTCIGFASAALAETPVLFIAGPKSHDVGQHEHPEGCRLLAAHLNSGGLGIRAEVSEGWPDDAAKISAAATLVIYGDGIDDHPAKGRLEELRARHKAGKGLAVLHFALEPADAGMAAFFDEAIGGHFSPEWSVNPVWKMKDPLFAKHPATRGVETYGIEDEFYYHIRLRENVIPLLRALPPADSLGDDGPRSGNPAVRKALADGVPQTLAWAVENDNGSRGFGFTGGHFHHLWSHKDFRKLVLNAIVWTAKVEVPENGVTSNIAAKPVHESIDQAIAKDDLADVKLHLAANPESLHKGGRANSRPPLEQAILRNKTAIAVFLIESGAKPDGPEGSPRTPLHLSIERNNPTVLAALLKAGAKPSPPDQAGWTPLHHAAAKNQAANAKILLEGGANPMALSELGGTPLHEAAASGGAEIIRLLLDYKVDPKLKSKQNVTALDLAKEYKNQPAIEILGGL